MKALIMFIRDVFSDGGTASFSRVASGFALIFAIRWVDHVIRRTGQIPDLLNVLYFVGGLYSINRISSILEAYVTAKVGGTAAPKPV